MVYWVDSVDFCMGGRGCNVISWMIVWWFGVDVAGVEVVFDY